MNKALSIFSLVCSLYFQISVTSGQSGRLESEYKLDIPLSEVSALWSFIKSNYALEHFTFNDMNLRGQESVELFIDQYFDEPNLSFAEAEISLRYRKRFKDDILLKELVQLKTPYSKDKVIRNEIKFDVDRKKNFDDLFIRHPLLRLLNGSDTERMRYHLADFGLRPEEIQESVKLKQRRSRIYISDNKGESIATITLDEVNHNSFPFQEYAELELELNEIKFTEASDEERILMTELNDNIKTNLSKNFPNLSVDQRSKYRKMKAMVDESFLSKVYNNMMWICFGCIVCFSSLFFIKDHLL